jgi:hypothetical protein
MNGIAVLVGLAVVGVDYGWQPTADGQLEYIIQIEPELLESLKNGDEIVSEILPQARGVRKFRIRVGKEAVPREGQLRGETTPRSLSTPSSGTTGAVLPPADPQAGWGTPPSDSGRLSDNEFRPDGRLNLPPPPPLLDTDGKNSVLVRPGQGSANAPSRNSSGEVLPPGATGAEPRQPGPVELTPSTNSNNGGGWPIPPATGPSDITPPTGPVLPPADSTFPNQPGGLVLPPTDAETTPDADQLEVRPVPSPPTGSGPPRPIRVGDSGVRPPSSGESFTRAAPRDTTTLEEGQPREGETMGKPTLDEATAEKLQPPWKPLVFTSLALFASLAANLYLGWVALGIYRRYREVVAQLHQASASLT